MHNRIIRDIVNLLLYGGAFIGLCAACITALSFELLGGVEHHLDYVLLIGVATAALYSAHRVIGLHKLAHVTTHERYSVIRKYKVHIWLYCIGWICLSFWLLTPFADAKFIFWLMPGGVIALSYVLPMLSGGRRLRDLGWTKIVLIGWSWSWLTAFLPAYLFAHVPLYLSMIIGIERFLFIVAITIPFEIRDLSIDRSVGLSTMPSRFGLNKSIRLGNLMCILTILMAVFVAFHFLNPAYAISMFVVCLMAMWVLRKSKTVFDDYFFSGLTDGLMIIAVIVYWMAESIN